MSADNSENNSAPTPITSHTTASELMLYNTSDPIQNYYNAVYDNLFINYQEGIEKIAKYIRNSESNLDTIIGIILGNTFLLVDDYSDESPCRTVYRFFDTDSDIYYFVEETEDILDKLFPREQREYTVCLCEDEEEEYLDFMYYLIDTSHDITTNSPTNIFINPRYLFNKLRDFMFRISMNDLHKFIKYDYDYVNIQKYTAENSPFKQSVRESIEMWE